MSNTFLTAQEIARQALPILKDNLVFPMLTYTDYAEDFANVGDTIQIRKPPVYEAKEFNGTIETQHIQEDKVMVTMVIEPAAIAIAEKINRDGLSLYKDVYTVGGTAGTAPSSLEDLAAARKVLNINKAPVFPRYAVWDPEADMNFSVIPAIVNAEKSGSTEALREGSIGRIQGVDNYMSQAIHSHMPQVNASGLTVKSAVTAGSDSLSISGTALTGKFIKGDILTISGQTYTVTEDSADSASNTVASVKVAPALPQLAAGTAVTVAGAHAANLVFHKNAFAFVSRPLELARGAESYVTSFEGITLRVTFSYDAATKKQMLSIDTLYGFKTIYPQLAMRYMG